MAVIAIRGNFPTGVMVPGEWGGIVVPGEVVPRGSYPVIGSNSPSTG